MLQKLLDWDVRMLLKMLDMIREHFVKSCECRVSFLFWGNKMLKINGVAFWASTSMFPCSGLRDDGFQ